LKSKVRINEKSTMRMLVGHRSGIELKRGKRNRPRNWNHGPESDTEQAYRLGIGGFRTHDRIWSQKGKVDIGKLCLEKKRSNRGR